MSHDPKSKDFDPYSAWLGIAPGPRPPTPEDLLGIAPGESNADRILAAAMERKKRLNGFALSEHNKLASDLASEVADAMSLLMKGAESAQAAIQQQLPSLSSETRATKDFDPYTVLLGIPPGPRPPSPEVLLGVPPGEMDERRLFEAFIGQRNRLGEFALSEYRPHASDLAGEVADALSHLLKRAASAPKPVKSPRPEVAVPAIAAAPAETAVRASAAAPVTTVAGEPVQEEWRLDDAAEAAGVVVPVAVKVGPRWKRAGVSFLRFLRVGFLRLLRFLGRMTLFPFRSVDAMLGAVAGEGNEIVHWFLRVMAATVVSFCIAGGVLLSNKSAQSPTRVGTPHTPPTPPQTAPAQAAIRLDLGDGVTLELVLIPAGNFLMGSPNSDEDARPDEIPCHDVRITRPFYLGKYEVTQEQWQAVMGANPSRFQGPKNPVENVSWHDCQDFIKKINKKDEGAGVLFGLPTEAQWEYACRAGTKTRWSFGDDTSSVGDYAWCFGNSGQRTQPVGQKKPNAWGLYDMHGNVSEWCVDKYMAEFYAISRAEDPVGPGLGAARVLRGGSWKYVPFNARSAFRFWNPPDISNDSTGFRVAMIQ